GVRAKARQVTDKPAPRLKVVVEPPIAVAQKRFERAIQRLGRARLDAEEWRRLQVDRTIDVARKRERQRRADARIALDDIRVVPHVVHSAASMVTVRKTSTAITINRFSARKSRSLVVCRRAP